MGTQVFGVWQPRDNMWSSTGMAFIHFYLFYPAQDTAKIYWSRDEQGQHIIEDSLIQASFGVIIDWDWDWNVYVYPIPPQFYGILSTFHEACGFDPYSTQVAEYLGLPWAVIDNGHPGLEEYVEDPEYSSESGSGDSDYVSASEDAIYIKAAQSYRLLCGQEMESLKESQHVTQAQELLVIPNHILPITQN
ncbi:hypothetical protein C8J56DRAFT_1082096 [Mycena floridula]|nr:hypothetical protein C8J56DRAFT_1082096 [Mycena floridula]